LIQIVGIKKKNKNENKKSKVKKMNKYLLRRRILTQL